MGNGGSTGGGGAKAAPPKSSAPVFICDDTASEMYTTKFDEGGIPKLLYCDEFDVFDTHNLSQKKTIMLGREKPCDVLVTNSEVSKKHLTISFDDGKFVVSTMSQFGTGLFNEEATTVVAENDAVPISGSGLMKLGRSIVGFNSKKLEHLLIEVIDGDAKGRKWATGPKAKSFYVGRSEECPVKMPTAGSSISGKHLEFQKHIDGGWTVMDNSTFGTLVCGDWPLRKGKKCLVVPGMTLEIGKEHQMQKLIIKTLDD
mmetsp:Transcript_24767/g.66818  ORF Transcript_24767/g.66818 Transcript_24767/m.66818 type:complete len:257 (+) Transcript_24767:38-808(+)